jgi:hypothetical protein
MSEMTRATIVGVLLRLLREAFAGSPGSWTYFTDGGPGSGLFGTLDALSATQASQVSGPGGSSIAGHVHHVCSSLALSLRELRGESTSRDRSQSWTASSLDDAGWAALRGRLRQEYEHASMAVQTLGDWNEDALATAFGAVAHAAYHLGAIRQRLAVQAAASDGER